MTGRSILMMVLISGFLPLFAQAGFKPKDKPGMKVPLVSAGVYLSTGFLLNSTLNGTIDDINASGRKTGSPALASQKSNYFLAGGILMRHFLQYLKPVEDLGIQVNAEYALLENANSGIAIAGDPRNAIEYDFKRQSALTISPAVLYTLYRAPSLAVHAGAGPLLSQINVEYGYANATGGTLTHKLSGSGIGANALISVEFKFREHVNFFGDINFRYLAVKKLQSDQGGLLTRKKPAGITVTEDTPTVLEVDKSITESTLSWDQSGLQFQFGALFYYK